MIILKHKKIFWMKKILFLDRDGVINEDFRYVYKIEDIIFKDGIFPFCKKFQMEGYEIIIVTNQSGIARQKYSLEDYYKVQNYITDIFFSNNIVILDTYFCPHHPDIKCECRKPNIGMFEQANKDHNIDFSNSVMIGDKITDLIPAYKVGIRNLFLLKSNYKKEKVNFSFLEIENLENIL